MEQRTRVVRGILAPVAAAVAVVLGASSVSAQLAVRNPNDKVLFLAPQPVQTADSAYAVNLGDEVRDRMGSQLRHKMLVVTTKDICNVLRESAYECGIILTPADADRLARAMQVDAFISGSLDRDEGAPVARLHLLDLKRSGLSGWLTVHGAAGASPHDFAQSIVDSLENQVKAGDYARECRERLDRQDYDAAKQRAERAFALYPYHPSAALCVSVVAEAEQQPVDSQIVYLERAAKGDSTIARTWELLGRRYNQAGDSLKALDAFTNQSELTPANRDLRVGVILGATLLQQYPQAADLADRWLESHPDDLDVLRLKKDACVKGGLWSCALQSMSRQYELDSTAAGDSTFYQQVIGAAQAAGDTAAQLRWSGLAVQHFPNSQPLLRAHADALNAAGMQDSVVTVYEHLLALDSTDVATALRAAQILLQDLPIDTAIPLDTARLLKGGTFLRQASTAARATNDTAVMMNVALLRYQKGRALVEKRLLIPTAVEWLQLADSNDVRQALTQPVNFFLGLGLLYQIYAFDPQVTESKSCDLVEQEADMIARGKSAMQKGAPIAASTAQQLLTQYQNMEARLPTLRKAFKCR